MTILSRVQRAIDSVPIIDLHTHLFAPQFGSLNLWGIDELLTYHYLIAEVLRAKPNLNPEAFLSQTISDQADQIWQTLFVERAPISEACTGVCTVLSELSLDPAAQNLHDIRAWFQSQNPDQHLTRVLALANIECVTMTNDPFDPDESQFWQSQTPYDPRFLPVLRIDPLVNNFEITQTQIPGNSDPLTNATNFIAASIDQMHPRYMAVSLPYDFQYPGQDSRTEIFDKIILPACKKHNLPLALMIGTNRQVNPRLGQAGDGIGTADLHSLETLCRNHPEITFVVTTLSRENAQHLCVIARKFANLKIFGCWWFMNNPSLIEEVTDLRFELLGDTFIPQHSDARILEQLIYKWKHSREIIAKSLTKRFEALEKAGRRVSDDEITATCQKLLRTNALDILETTSSS